MSTLRRWAPQQASHEKKKKYNMYILIVGMCMGFNSLFSQKSNSKRN